MAVMIYVEAEEWEWESVYKKGATSDGILNKITGGGSLSTKSAIDYSFRIGLPRILDMLAKHDLRLTFYTSGLAAANYPDLFREISNKGHEVIGHAYTQDTRMNLLTRDQQKENIRKTISTIEKITEKKVLGWDSPGACCNEDTIELLAEEGMLYHADLQGDELPYFVDVNGMSMVEIPWLRLHIPNDLNLFGNPQRYPIDNSIRFLKQMFDIYYREAFKRPMLFRYGAHTVISGKPEATYVLDEFISYIRMHKDVWVPKYADVAKWWMEKFKTVDS